MTITYGFFPFSTVECLLHQRSLLDVSPVTNNTTSFCIAFNKQVDFLNFMYSQFQGFAGIKNFSSLVAEYSCFFKRK